MNTFLKGLSSFSTRAVYAIYGILATILIINYIFDFNNDNYVTLILGFLLMCFVGTYILNKASLYLEKLSEKKCIIFLVTFCFIIKLTWVLLHRIEPLVDYATFFYTAESLSESFVIDKRYVALFPHIFGYSWFLSFFIKIFGSSYMLPPIINVVLTTISMLLIYFICKKIIGSREAIIACILWILIPSQTIYNMFALSEPLYCTILLIIWIVMILIYEKIKNLDTKKMLLYTILLAILLVLMNMARPIAAIPIIALIIWLLIIDTGHMANRKILFK